MTMSLTVRAGRVLDRLDVRRASVERMAKRRWPVIALFHGVGGAGEIGSGTFGRLPLADVARWP